MRKYGYVFLFAFVFLIGITNTKAECSNSEIVKYQELAKNIKATYDYTETNNIVLFKVRINNISEGLIIQDKTKSKNYDYKGSELVIDRDFVSGSYKFSVLASACDNRTVYSFYVNLPFYNPFYKSSLCEGIEEFHYCQKWGKSPDDYQEFKEAIEEYKKKLAEKNKKQEEQEDLVDTILNFSKKYFYLVIILIVLIGVGIRALYNKKHDLF